MPEEKNQKSTLRQSLRKTIKSQKSTVKEPFKKVAVKKPSKLAKKEGAILIDVFDTKGKVAEQIELPKELFGAHVNPSLMAQAVRVHLFNTRKGTLSTKTRGEVQGSTRKIYKQKGTGRARHGAIRAPIFVHGGVAHGPKPRDFSLSFPKNMRRAALTSALTAKLNDGKIKIVSGLETLIPKTKNMVQVLKNLSLDEKKKKILLVVPLSSTSESSKTNDVANIVRAVRNIEGVTLTSASTLNTYSVLDAKTLLFIKESVPVLTQTFAKQNTL